MSVAVLVPRGGDCPYRERAWSWIRPRYPWPVVEGFCDGEWVKARAVADAFRQTAADLLVVADSDCWADNLEETVQVVEDGAPWATPHHQVARLHQTSTERLYAEGFARRFSNRDYRGHRGVPGGGIVVLRRETLEQVPLDPRFVGWGGEDHAWGYALTTLAGRPRRGQALLWHLWHPPAPRLPSKFASEKNGALYRRYRQARKEPAEMRSIVQEIPEWQLRSST